MAKAQFKKNQRVWVDSVGAWASVERVVPSWVGGLTEPVRVTYDVGLGRMFQAFELTADPRDAPEPPSQETWRVGRGRNRWRTDEDASKHPTPGTYPIIYTDPQDWGGWRVPRAEYDRDPARIEAQARMIAAAPKMRALIQDLITLIANDAATPQVLRGLARRAATLELELRDLHGDEAALAKSKSAPNVEAPPASSASLLRPSRTPSPPSEDFKSSSLAERMAALERELNLRPRAPDVFTPAPRGAAAAPPPEAPATAPSAMSPQAPGFRPPTLSERMAALERELKLRPRAQAVFTPAPSRDPAAPTDTPQDATTVRFLRRRPK